MFAARLRELRGQAGMTQAAVAKAIGTSVRSISRLETGTQQPTWETVVALKNALNEAGLTPPIDCSAFEVEPSSIEPHGRGRPPAKLPQAKSPRKRKTK